MGFTTRTTGTAAVWLAFMMCGVHPAVAAGDPPPSAVPDKPAKADTAAATPAAAASTTPLTEGAAPGATTAEKDKAPRAPAVVVTSTLEDSVLSNTEVKRLLSAGYRQEKMSNGDVLYCRKEDHLGSMIAKKQCVTGPQLKAMAEDKRQFNDLVQEKAGVNPRPSPASASSP